MKSFFENFLKGFCFLLVISIPFFLNEESKDAWGFTLFLCVVVGLITGATGYFVKMGDDSEKSYVTRSRIVIYGLILLVLITLVASSLFGEFAFSDEYFRKWLVEYNPVL